MPCLRGGQKVEAIYPILDWTNEDIVEFVQDRNIKLHRLYYREDGTIDPTKRLGCQACPLASRRKRIEQFKNNPRLVIAWVRAGEKYLKNHPNTESGKRYTSAYQFFYRDLFCDSNEEFYALDNNLFGQPDYKKLLEDFFGIKFPT